MHWAIHPKIDPVWAIVKGNNFLHLRAQQRLKSLLSNTTRIKLFGLHLPSQISLLSPTIKAIQLVQKSPDFVGSLWLPLDWLRNPKIYFWGTFVSWFQNQKDYLAQGYMLIFLENAFHSDSLFSSSSSHLACLAHIFPIGDPNPMELFPLETRCLNISNDTYFIQFGSESRKLWPRETDAATVGWPWTLGTFNTLGNFTLRDLIHGPPYSQCYKYLF